MRGRSISNYKTRIMRLSAAVIMGLSGLGAGAAPLIFKGTAFAAPSTVFVRKMNCSDLNPGTKQKPFCTIQKGVTSVPNNGTVDVGSGVFNEQVVVSGKSLTITGNGDETVIKMPTATTAGGAIVDVTNSPDFRLNRIKVAGPFNVDSCATEEYGVRLNNGVNAKLNNVTVADIRPASDSFFGCQEGVGILVGSGGAVAQANLQHVTVTGYAKDGIEVDGTGTSATINQSTVTGRGPTALTAQNGIQISRGAAATLTQNNVSGNVYTGDAGVTTATGILIYQAGAITARQNIVKSNDVGFDVDTQNSTFRQNVVNNNTTDGFFVEATATGNLFRQNTAHNNTGSTAYPPYDVEDDSTGAGTNGTANTYRNNDCNTSLPAGLCVE